MSIRVNVVQNRHMRSGRMGPKIGHLEYCRAVGEPRTNPFLSLFHPSPSEHHILFFSIFSPYHEL